MVAELVTKNEDLARLGVREYNARLETGKIDEGAVVGKLMILRLSAKQQMPLERLKDIFLAAGLSENQLPNERVGADAWRCATKELDGTEIAAPRSGGRVKVLVRDWKGGTDPRRDITLERQESKNDRFTYASPAAVITYESRGKRMAWDNRLSVLGEDGGEMYRLLEDLLDRAKERFERYKTYVDGEAIYRALRRHVIDPTAPLPMGTGSYLIWSEHDGIVQAISSIVAALNETCPEEAQSVANIFTVVNTSDDRRTLSQALDATVATEVEGAIERMARVLKDPSRLVDSQAKYEEEHYLQLLQTVSAYKTRFDKDSRSIDTQLRLLEDGIMELKQGVARANQTKQMQREAAAKRSAR